MNTVSLSIVILIIIVGLLSTISLIGGTDKKISIGYCPTMAKYAELFNSNKFIRLKPYPSTQSALEAMASEKVDAAIVGRKAKPEEISPNTTHSQVFEEDSTLVSLRNGDPNETILTKWKDVDYSNMDLVVTTHEDGSKVGKYRTPFIYYQHQLNESLREQIISTIKGNRS